MRRLREMRGRATESGLTITEILVVVAVIGILLVITIPNFNAFLRSYRVGTSVDQMVSMLNLARQRAVTERETHFFLAFADPDNRWRLMKSGVTEPLFEGELPEGVTIDAAVAFTFDSNGACTTPTVPGGDQPPTSQFIQVEGSITSSRTDRYLLEVSPVGRVKTTQQRLTS